MTIRNAVILLMVSGLLALRPLDAHHSFAAEFDASKPVKLTGPVTKVDWTNPHAWIYMNVKNEMGQAANWGFELASPNTLMRNGWTRTSLKAGDIVTIEGSQARDGSTNANAQVVTIPGTGQRLFSGPSPNQQP